jgi:hypothetical protein
MILKLSSQRSFCQNTEVPFFLVVCLYNYLHFNVILITTGYFLDLKIVSAFHNMFYYYDYVKQYNQGG